MKRASTILLLLCMAGALLCSCNGGAKQSDSVIPAVTELTTGAITTTAAKTAPYDYNQAKNVIDDNYRTYYEVFVASYHDSNGDGMGDLNGLTSKLDYIAEMGFNGIWLMPIMPSPSYHKYDVVDYYAIDEAYGTLDDFKNLIAECNKRGIKVIIDLVLNHSSSEHEWFKSACESIVIPDCGKQICTSTPLCSKHNKYCAYYNFANDKANVDGFHKVGDSEWYYEGGFQYGMPDLNLESPDLRGDIEAIAKYWLDLDVGGFRLDAAKEYYSGNNDKNIAVLKWFNDYCHGIDKDCYVVGEVWDNSTVYSTYYQSGINSVFNFAFAQQKGQIATTLNMSDASHSGKAYGEALVYFQDLLAKNSPTAIDAPFFTNHDTARAAGFFSYNPDKIKTAWGMNLLMSGSAFVYYGEEIGMTGSGKDENKRAPMRWSATDKTGITNGPPDMEVMENHFAAADEQARDDASIQNYIKRAVQLRNENPEIARGVTAAIPVDDMDICAITKAYNESVLYIVYNLSAVEKTLTLEKPAFACEGLRGYLSATGAEITLDGGKLTLPAYSIAVLK